MSPVAYRVVLDPLVRRQLIGWGLPDGVLVDVHLRLTDDLSTHPALVLERRQAPFDGMQYRFEMIDPDNRLCVHAFAFHILYGQDEEALHVACGAYLRSFGV
jgi:hypothetical protein